MKEIDIGFVNIDKPASWTSFDVVNAVRSALRIKKIGHLGTLDPMVTGVLPICIGKAAKLQNWLMKKDKTYVGCMHLHKPILKKDLEAEMKKFIGVIDQLPPIKSRVKRQMRKREVYSFKITKYDKEKRDVEFITKVEGGTYIRKLIHDLGEKIGGAHMTYLRRTQAGMFSDKDKGMVTIEEFREIAKAYREGKPTKLKKIVIPAEDIVKDIMPIIKVDKKTAEALRKGSPIFDRMISRTKDLLIINSEKDFAVVDEKGKLVEIAAKAEREDYPDIIAMSKWVCN